MASWSEILNELNREGVTTDSIRQHYLSELHALTGRNVISYYSGWLQKPGAAQIIINDLDKNAFMATIHGMDRSKGLDLILHTPGGDVAATESIIDYLLQMFDDIRVIVPQLCMSGGTMIACASNCIIMGKHSSLGPVDPQLPTPQGQLSVQAILEEFKMALDAIKLDPASAHVWHPIISKYSITLIGECEKAVKWADQITSSNLALRMFKDLELSARDAKIKTIMAEVGDHAISLTHNRHLSVQKCESIGLNIQRLESDQALQETVLSIHHATMLTFSMTLASKIIENHNAVLVVHSAATVN